MILPQLQRQPAVVRAPKNQKRSGHHGEGKVIPVAAGVAGLEFYPLHAQDRTVREVGEGAGNRLGGGVADDFEDGPGGRGRRREKDELELRAGVERRIAGRLRSFRVADSEDFDEPDAC